MDKLLSVIIPVYNGEKWVQRAVKSVVDQPCSNYIEIILVNDGSTDNSAQVCERIANENKNVIIIHKKNEGVSVARNTGIKNAKGKYLAFLDCDDWWEKDFFDNEILNELRNDVDVFSFSYRYIDFTMKYEKVFFAKNEKLEFETIGSIECDWKPHVSYFYNKLFLHENNLLYPDFIKVAEDMVFIEKCHFCALSKKSINKICYNYLLNRSSVMHTIRRLALLDEYLKCANHLKEFYAKYDITYSANQLKNISKVLPDLCSQKNFSECQEFLAKHQFLEQINDVSMANLNKKQKKNVKSWISHPYLFWLKNRIFYSMFLRAKKIAYYQPFLLKIVSYIKYKIVQGYNSYNNF